MNGKQVVAVLAILLGLSRVGLCQPANVELIAGRTLERLKAELGDSNRTVRLRAAKTASMFGDAALPVLADMLKHRDASIRYYGAIGLGDRPNAARRYVEPLRSLFEADPSSGVRTAAAYALARLQADSEALERLVASAASKERGEAVSAADLLGRLGESANSALGELEAILKRHTTGAGADYHVRGAVQNALRLIRGQAALIAHQRPKTGGAFRTWRSQASGGPNPRPLQGDTGDPNRHNVLWISCEDISPNLGCYGDDYASTPKLDQLAREGARYRFAFTPAGVCAVVRSGVITGMYPVSIGSQHMRSKIVPPSVVRCFPEYLRAAGYFCTNKSKTDYQFDSPITAWDRQGNNHRDWRDRAPGQPFFSVINLTISHESQIRHSDELHEKLLQKLAPNQRHAPERGVASLPPIYSPTPETLKDWARYHDNISEMDRQVGEILKRLEDDGLAESTIVVFWSDHGRGLPRGKRWIYDSGVHIPLIVRWPGVVEPGSVSEELISTQDLAPTTLTMAGLDPPAYMHGRIFVGEGKEESPPYLFFHRDRMDEAIDLMRGARDRRYKYIRNYESQRTYAQHIDYMDMMPTLVDLRRLNAEGRLRGPQKVFFAEQKPIEELYDLHSDPHETNNLAANPQFADTLGRMRDAVETWQADIGDMGLIPEPIMMEQMRPGNRMERTAPVSVTFQADEDKQQASLACETPGASIAFAIGDEPFWRLYVSPFAVASGQLLRAKAIRLGFSPSDVVRSKAPLAP